MEIEKKFAGNLQNILSQKSLTWIFVGGKGGVGKTTCSSSLAVQLARTRNEKILIISTDPAHNLSDAFGQKIGSTPTQINGCSNLYGLEFDPNLNEDNITMSNVLGFSLDSNSKGIMNEITSSIPGIDEAMCLGYIMKLVQNMDFGCVVFDTAPTGHTLRLLNFPNILKKGLEKLISIKENFSGVIQNMNSLFGQNFDQIYENLFVSLDSLKENLEKINVQFKDVNKTTFVAVCIPEFLSMYETERLSQELFKFEIDIRNVVINQVLFDCGNNCKMCNSRRKMQKKYIDQIEQLFEDFHITILPLFEEEVRGIQGIHTFSEMLVNPPVFK